MRGKVKVTNDELITEEGADDLLSKCIEGCEGTININTPFGSYRFKRDKKDKKIKKIKPGQGRP